MKSIVQVLIVATSLAVLGQPCDAAPELKKLAGKYKVVKVTKAKFLTGLDMLGLEQEEYAKQLTCYAVAEIIANKGSQESLDQARKMIGLALNLSPRNRQAIVANVQLSKGVVPKAPKKAYNRAILATLLAARAQQQVAAKGKNNKLLAQCFFQLAADLNPNHEEAVYQSALMEQDFGAVDWSQFSGK